MTLPRLSAARLALLSTLPVLLITLTDRSLALAEGGVRQEAASKGPPPAPVRVATIVREQHAPRKKVFGELRPSRRTTVAAEEPGIVRACDVRVGDRVRAGDVLAELDPTRIRLEQVVLKADIGVARTTIAEREAEEARESRDLELLQVAAKAGGTNPREIADAESSLAVARARVEQARAALGVLEARGELLNRRLADLRIAAPFDGVVTARSIEAGAWVSAGGEVVDLAETARLEAWFDVPQEFFVQAVELSARAKASGGSDAVPIPATLSVESSSGAPIAARAFRIVPEIDDRSRTFHAIAEIDNAEGMLAAGLAVQAYVPQGAPVDVVLVPKDALVYRGVAPTIFVVRNGVAQSLVLTVLFPLGDRVAVAGAIEEFVGASVVVEGNERLMPGSPVAPIDAPAAAGSRAEAHP